MLKLFRQDKEYLTKFRLADVLALLQVLALDEDTHRSEEGLTSELQGLPKSGNSWVHIAKKHPEFFRVKAEGTHRVSLVSRHVSPKDSRGVHSLSPEFVGQLMATAVDIYDRQLRRSERWIYLVPIWVALITGVFLIVGIVVKELLAA